MSKVIPTEDQVQIKKLSEDLSKEVMKMFDENSVSVALCSLCATTSAFFAEVCPDEKKFEVLLERFRDSSREVFVKRYKVRTNDEMDLS